MVSNQISKIKVKKNECILTINNKEYPIDSYYYECILPYLKKVLSVSEMLELIAFSNANLILKKSYKNIFAHTISCYEFKCKLTNNDIDEQQVNLIIKRLKNEGLLNDEDFVNHYKEIYQYKKGKKAFKNFLINKHIPSYIIDKSLLTYNENKEYAINYAQKYVNSKVASTNMIKQMLLAHLINKGFEKETINEVFENIIFKDENESLIIELKKYHKKYPNDYYKVVSKLANKGYNVNEIKKMMRKEGMYNEN